ncbi:MAG: hypothetical protein JW982_06560 [Spirochaetes bacterium]|nr:hypothetical protein [Spirochaetota bacterium]
MKYFLIIILSAVCTICSFARNGGYENWNFMFEKYPLEYLRSENPDDVFKLLNDGKSVSASEKDMFYHDLEKYITVCIEPGNRNYIIISGILEDILDLMEVCEQQGTFFNHMRNRLGAYSLWLDYSVLTADKNVTLKYIADNIIKNGTERGNQVLVTERYEKCINDANKISSPVMYGNIIWFYENYMK